FFSRRRRHTRSKRDWSSDVCSSDLQQLNEVQKDEFFEVLRNSFPPALLELCLFDGEEISKLTNGNILSRYLKDLSTKLFNLDLRSEDRRVGKYYRSMMSRRHWIRTN